MKKRYYKQVLFTCGLLAIFSVKLFAQESVEGSIDMSPSKPKTNNCYSWKTVYSAGPYEVKYCASVDDTKSKYWRTVVYIKSTFPESAYLILHADVRHKDGEYRDNQRIAGGTLYKGNGFEDYGQCDYVSFNNERIKYLKIGNKVIYDNFQRTNY